MFRMDVLHKRILARRLIMLYKYFNRFAHQYLCDHFKFTHNVYLACNQKLLAIHLLIMDEMNTTRSASHINLQANGKGYNLVNCLLSHCLYLTNYFFLLLLFFIILFLHLFYLFMLS